MQVTLWKFIAGYEGIYEVSDTGHVRNARTGKVLKPMRTGQKRKQYSTVALCGFGEQKHRKVHHLVLEAFVGARPPGFIGLHKDDNTENNALHNLAWGTHKENAHAAVTNGDTKLTQQQCAEIVRRRKTERGKVLAAEFGVSMQTICDLVKGRRRTFKPEV